jgi:predicted CoA-binding protein
MDDEDALLREVLTLDGAWAVVGWSPRPARPSHTVTDYLEAVGYHVVRVNPTAKGPDDRPPVLASLADLEGPVAVVDVFRRSSLAGAVVDEAIAVGARAVWLQLGVVDEAAAERARAAGLLVVMDRCPAIERPRLFGR